MSVVVVVVAVESGALEGGRLGWGRASQSITDVHPVYIHITV
jgi:hypothetical protein